MVYIIGDDGGREQAAAVKGKKVRRRVCLRCGAKNPVEKPDGSPNDLCYSCGAALPPTPKVQKSLRVGQLLAKGRAGDSAAYGELVKMVGREKAADLIVNPPTPEERSM